MAAVYASAHEPDDSPQGPGARWLVSFVGGDARDLALREREFTEP